MKTSLVISTLTALTLSALCFSAAAAEDGTQEKYIAPESIEDGIATIYANSRVLENGSYKMVKTKVCQGPIHVGVYKLSQDGKLGGTMDNKSGFSCTSSLLGVKVYPGILAYKIHGVITKEMISTPETKIYEKYVGKKTTLLIATLFVLPITSPATGSNQELTAKESEDYLRIVKYIQKLTTSNVNLIGDNSGAQLINLQAPWESCWDNEKHANDSVCLSKEDFTAEILIESKK